jgi:hypothetical protein
MSVPWSYFLNVRKYNDFEGELIAKEIYDMCPRALQFTVNISFQRR